MTKKRTVAVSALTAAAGLSFAAPCFSQKNPAPPAPPAPPAAPASAVAPAASRPNVLIFITDDESWLERSAYGWSNLPTPHFDRVARDGVLFTRGYTSAPSCAPSRAALLTGKNFWELEQGAFIQAWLPPKFPRLPDVMAAAGYAAGYTGKGWGPGIPPPDLPKSAYRSPAGPAYNSIKYKKPEPGIGAFDYPANFEAFLDARAKEAADSKGEKKPFCFWVGCIEPHTPLGPDNYKKLEARTGISPDKVKMPGFMPDTPATRRERANIWYELCHADDDLGRILKTLETRGELENTIVIVTGDNGTQIPYSKATPYDWGVHVPLAIMWPARVPAGRRVDDFVNFADLAPTVLDAAGIAIPKDMSGRSILPALESKKSGRVDPARSWMVTGLEWHGELPPYSSAARAIRDDRYEYIVNYGKRPANRTPPGRGPSPDFKPGAGGNAGTWEELYDCEADPWELKNLIDSTDAKHVEAKTRLKARMREYLLKTKDPRVTGDMKIFDETRAMVEKRKASGYSEK